MRYFKFLWQAYPWAFLLCLLALLLDLIGFGDTPTQRVTWFAPTFAVCLYWIGITLLIRFKITKRPVQLAITWAIMIPMYFVGFTALAILTNSFEGRGGPAIIFFLASIYAFRTLRTKDPTN